MNQLTCKECGAPVATVDEADHRPCGHNTAGVIAHCSATCYGEGGAVVAVKPSPLLRVLQFMSGLIRKPGH